MIKDSWGRTIEYVRLSLTEACNFCCPYCRPEEITPESQTNLVNVEEWLAILNAFHLLGVRAVRLTGGEPLVYPHIMELLKRIKATAWFEDISMTTNGSFLAARAHELKAAGLDRLNISLDTVDPDMFDLRTGRKGYLGAVIKGIETAISLDFKEVKINTVLMDALTDSEVRTLLAYMEKWPVIWRFIEYMPFQGSIYKSPTFEEWREQLERVSGGDLIPIGDATEGFGPATYYALPNGRKVGFIFPLSHSYCDSCNRVRLTSDGKLRLCLLRDEEANIVEQVRNGIIGEALATYIAGLLQLRKEEHDGADMDIPTRAMWRIGG